MLDRPLELTELSLVAGGPLYRLWRWMGLMRPPLGLMHRRIIVMALFAWAPLLILAILGGAGATGCLPFLKGLGAHMRLLVALPLLILAEGPVHARLGSTIRQLVNRSVVPPEQVPQLNAIVRSIHRLRDSVVPELCLLVLVYTIGQWSWREYWASGRASWYAVTSESGWHLTLAGWWYAFISVPLFQFILLRWIFRLALWFYFLWHTARLNLHLIPTHPDRAGGIGGFGTSTEAFGLFLFAEGTLLAGQIGQRILFEGHSLLTYKIDIFVLVAILVAIVLAPLLVFIPILYHAKLRGRSEYSALAHRYVLEFDNKWVRHAANAEERFIGTADIQSLADMANSYSVVRSMRAVPFGSDLVAYLTAMALIPLVPLTLTVVPFEKMIDYFIKGIL